MNESNKHTAIAAAVLTVVVAIGLSVWYAGSLEAEDDMYDSSASGRSGSPLDHFEMVEDQISPDQNGNIEIDEEEVDFSTQPPKPPVTIPQRR